MKHLIVILIIVFAVIQTSAEPNKYYFITKNGDTTFCKELRYATSRHGEIVRLEYTNLKEKKIKINKEENIPPIITVFKDGETLDKIPLKVSKPDGKVNYTKREVGGKLTIYREVQTTEMREEHGTYATNSGMQGGYSRSNGLNTGYKNVKTLTGHNIFVLKMPDGTFYEIDKSNMDKFIKPYLQKCEKFTKAYTGKYSVEQAPFIEMIRSYNNFCE